MNECCIPQHSELNLFESLLPSPFSSCSVEFVFQLFRLIFGAMVFTAELQGLLQKAKAPEAFMK